MCHKRYTRGTVYTGVIIVTIILQFTVAAFINAPYKEQGLVMSIIHNNVSPLSTMYNSERKIVVDSKGAIYVPFIVGTQQGTFVHIAVSRDGGRSWVDLGQVPSSNNSARVSMAMDGRDVLHVVWTEGIGDRSQILYSEFNGSKWSAAVRVSNTPWYSGYPSLAIDSRGIAHVVWYGFDGENYRIFYSNNSLGMWSQPLKISQSTFDSVNPSIAIDSNDNLYVVWYMKISTHYQIWYRERTQAWQEPTLIDPSNSDSSSPVIAVDEHGNVHVVWTREVNGISQVFYALKKSGVWQKAVQISSGAEPAENPTLAIDSNNNPLVVWATDSGQIYYRRFSAQWQSVHLLSSEGMNLYPNSRWSYYYGGPRMYVDLIWTREAGGTFEEVFVRMVVSSSFG